MRFIDREEAAEQLVKKLDHYRGEAAAIYALPRGGVVIGAEVAQALNVPLDILFVRKIGHPYHPEYAIAAVVDDREPVTTSLAEDVDRQWFEEQIHKAKLENARRRALYFAPDYQPPNVRNQTALIVDDGAARGFTMLAAIRALRERHPHRIGVGLPVAPPDTVTKLREAADEVVIVDDPNHFGAAVSSHYILFPPVSDETVVALLQRRAQR